MCNHKTATPLISIRCKVFNHERYLRQCLDGFVMQKTTFPFEAIVHDDASTDGSAAIIREYAEKYPDIIKPIYETENQYCKHDGSLGKVLDANMHPHSKYIAYCEGDDYWTDPNKLQIQVDFLESHPDFVMCSHDYIEFYESSQEFAALSHCGRSKADENEGCNDFVEYSLDNYFRSWWTQPLTCVYRRGSYGQEIWNKGYSSSRDFIYYYYVLKHGKGALIKRLMGVYRKHGGGEWAKMDLTEQNRTSIKYAFEIYRIEKDKRALSLTRCQTLYLLGNLRKNGEKNFLMRELRYYYQNAPLYEFIGLIRDIVSIEASKKSQRLIKSLFKLK